MANDLLNKILLLQFILPVSFYFLKMWPLENVKSFMVYIIFQVALQMRLSVINFVEDSDGQNNAYALLCHQHELRLTWSGENLRPTPSRAGDLTLLPDRVFRNARPA